MCVCGLPSFLSLFFSSFPFSLIKFSLRAAFDTVSQTALDLRSYMVGYKTASESWKTSPAKHWGRCVYRPHFGSALIRFSNAYMTYVHFCCCPCPLLSSFIPPPPWAIGLTIPRLHWPKVILVKSRNIGPDKVFPKAYYKRTHLTSPNLATQPWP